MSDTTNTRLISIVILILFVIFISIPIVFVMTGIMWYALDQGQIVFWVTLNVVAGSFAAGIVLIYSLERYTQEHLFRDFLLVTICICVLYTGVFYLITSPVFVNPSSLFIRNRNRLILMFGAIVMSASPLVGSFASDEPIQRHERLLLILLTGVMGPMLEIYALFTPVQLITLSFMDRGPFQFTPEGLFLFCLVMIFMIVSLVKSLRAYYANRTNTYLALGLYFALYVVAAILVSITVTPMSVLEVSWLAAYVEGFVIISISVVMEVVVDPFRTLKTLVTKRTEELAESKRESEYYLNIWSHKVGNLLQELQLYLELLDSASDQQEVRKLSRSSLMLINDVEAINRQVRILTRIKNRQVGDLFPVSMKDAIRQAIQEVKAIFEDDVPEITFSEFRHDDYVLGDDLLSTIPFNIIMYIIKIQTAGKPKIRVSLSESPDHLIAHIQFKGKHISEDVETVLYDSLDPSRTTIGLDIYAVKILLSEYSGTFVYEDSPLGGQFIASIKKSPIKPSEDHHEGLNKTIDT